MREVKENARGPAVICASLDLPGRSQCRAEEADLCTLRASVIYFDGRSRPMRTAAINYADRSDVSW